MYKDTRAYVHGSSDPLDRDVAYIAQSVGSSLGFHLRKMGWRICTSNFCSVTEGLVICTLRNIRCYSASNTERRRNRQPTPGTELPEPEKLRQINLNGNPYCSLAEGTSVCFPVISALFALENGPTANIITSRRTGREIERERDRAPRSRGLNLQRKQLTADFLLFALSSSPVGRRVLPYT